jgi:hypothetical protein
MKILWVGDLHCQLRNIEEYGPMLQKLSGLASGCNYVVLAGDLLHGHSIIRTEPLNMVTNIVTTLARIVKVIVLVGNHDYINASQYCTDAHPFNAFKSIPGITVVDKPVVIDNMAFAPYVPPGRLVEALNEFAPEWAACKVVFAHQEILGAHEGHFVSEKGDKWNKSFPPLISGHIHCFTPDVEVLTNNGWRTFDHVLDTDLIGTCNLMTGNFEFQKIDSKFVKNDYCGDIITFLTKDIDISVTPEHNMALRDHQLLPASQITNYADLLKSCQNDVGLDMTDDMIRLIVWISADGNLELYTNKDGNSTIASVRFHIKKARKIERLTTLLDAMCIPYTEGLQATGNTKIRISNRGGRLDYILCHFGLSSKILPKCLVGMNRHQFDVFIEEYSHTDGTRNLDTFTQVNTSKRQEVDIFQEICVRNGACANVSKRKNSNNWTIGVTKDKHCAHVRHSKGSIRCSAYEGSIWCLTVKNGTLIVRRNGKVVITGNSRQRFDNVFYPGTPMQYTFGDDTNKQVSVFTIDDKNGITGNDFQLGLKTYKTFCLQVEDMDEFNCPENCYVRVQVLGDVSQLTAFKKSKKYKELVSLGVKIIPVPNEMKLQVEHTNKVTYLELLRRRVSLENQEVQMLFNELFSEGQ